MIFRLNEATHVEPCCHLARVLGRWRKGKASDETLQAAIRAAEGILK
jgi:hypothetical protein